MDQRDTDAGGFRQSGPGSFPGGKVRLPRLNAEDRATEPQIDVVGTAFKGGGTTVVDDIPEPSGFAGYFTYESLFNGSDEDELEDEDPYTVLRVTSNQPWEEIVAAHRSLVKEFHPDRFVDHPPEVVEQAEVEIKRINLAYGELRKRRASEGTDRRTGVDRRSS